VRNISKKQPLTCYSDKWQRKEGKGGKQRWITTHKTICNYGWLWNMYLERSCNKLSNSTVGRRAWLLPVIAASISGPVLAKQTHCPKSWNLASQFPKHREWMTETDLCWDCPVIQLLLHFLRLLHCKLVMIIYSRLILSLSLLSKQDRIGQNATSVFDRPHFMSNSSTN
jgi:competence transcription factor ComK